MDDRALAFGFLFCRGRARLVSRSQTAFFRFYSATPNKNGKKRSGYARLHINEIVSEVVSENAVRVQEKVQRCDGSSDTVCIQK